MNGLLDNPLLHLGIGLLSQRGNAGGLLSGMQSYSQMAKAQQEAEMKKAQFDAMQRQQQQAMEQRRIFAQQYGLPEGLIDAFPDAAGKYVENQLIPKTQNPTSDMQEYEFAKTQGYRGSFLDFMTSQRRAGATTVNVGGSQPIGLKDLQMLVNQQGDHPPIGMTLENAAQSGYRVASSNEQKAMLDKEMQKTKRESQLESKFAQVGLVSDLIDKAKSQANMWTTGFLGQKLSDIGGTKAHDLANNLNSIKANIGFDKLAQLRSESPTGGALGQVSERENLLLQSVWGALEQSQSEQQFKENLDAVKRQTRESWTRIKDAYKKDYGTEMDIPGTQAGKSNQNDGWSIKRK